MAEPRIEWMIKHYDQLIIDLKDSFAKQIEAERSINALHFKSLNDAASTIKDLKSTYVAMPWLDPKLEGIQKEIDDLKLTRAELAGKASNTTVIINYIITIILLILTILDFIK